MTEHFPGALQIGGQIPRTLLPQFLPLVNSSSRMYSGITTEEELVAAINPASGWLEIEDHFAVGGAFLDMECWLERNRIPFDRQSSGEHKYVAECVYFRPERGRLVFNGKHFPDIEDLPPLTFIDRAENLLP